MWLISSIKKERTSPKLKEKKRRKETIKKKKIDQELLSRGCRSFKFLDGRWPHGGSCRVWWRVLNSVHPSLSLSPLQKSTSCSFFSLFSHLSSSFPLLFIPTRLTDRYLLLAEGKLEHRKDAQDNIYLMHRRWRHHAVVIGRSVSAARCRRSSRESRVKDTR